MHAIAILQKRLDDVLARLDDRVWRRVWVAVRALLVGNALTLTALGRATAGPAAAKHRIKATDRLLGNGRLQAHLVLFWQGLAGLLLKHASTVEVLVDWTQVDARHHALFAAIPINGRALPILVHVRAHAEVPAKWMHRRFLDELVRILPAHCRPILITDAGFQATWIEEVERRRLGFVARVRHRTLLRPVGSGQWVSNKALHELCADEAQDLGEMEYPQTHCKVRRMILAARRRSKGRVRLGRRGRPLRGGASSSIAPREREPWLLATNLADPPAEIVRRYSHRMQIEETFRDAKNQRFGWSLRCARSRDPRRLAVLLLLAALGIFAVTLHGLAAEAHGLHHRLQANTERRRRVFSFFVLGALVLQQPGHGFLHVGDILRALQLLRESFRA